VLVANYSLQCYDFNILKADSMTTAKTVIIYQTVNGKEPFSDWLKELKDPVSRRRILKRLLRLEQGHYGDVKPVGGGVNELRFFFGSGYRIYFAEDGDTLIVLLCGGDKGSQQQDIQQAQIYWQEYQSHG
jgi:putative addiction module killer protein